VTRQSDRAEVIEHQPQPVLDENLIHHGLLPRTLDRPSRNPHQPLTCEHAVIFGTIELAGRLGGDKLAEVARSVSVWRSHGTEMTSSDDGLKLSDQLCFAAYAVSNAFKSTYKSLLDPHGLTYPQYLVLLVLWGENNLTVSQIGRSLHLDSGTLTPLLKRLEAAGILRRARDPEDERQVRITLTDKGFALKAPVAEARRQAACATGLPLSTLGVLRDEIFKVRESLEAYSDRRVVEQGEKK
jgi:DNA-binding MarR family transcriptional regulator